MTAPGTAPRSPVTPAGGGAPSPVDTNPHVLDGVAELMGRGRDVLEALEGRTLTALAPHREDLAEAIELLENVVGAIEHPQTPPPRPAPRHDTAVAEAAGVLTTGRRCLMTSLYLAGRFVTGPQLEVHATEARRLGLVVTSRWHAGSHGDPAADVDLTHPDMPRYAREDVDDVLAADVVVSFTEGGGGRGGRHVEFGLGLAAGKRLVVVGPREHVFHTLGHVEQYDTWPDALGALMVDAAVTEYLDDAIDPVGPTFASTPHRSGETPTEAAGRLPCRAPIAWDGIDTITEVCDRPVVRGHHRCDLGHVTTPGDDRGRELAELTKRWRRKADNLDTLASAPCALTGRAHDRPGSRAQAYARRKCADELADALAAPAEADWSSVVPADRDRAAEVATAAVVAGTGTSVGAATTADAVLDDLHSAGFRLVEGGLPGERDEPAPAGPQAEEAGGDHA